MIINNYYVEKICHGNIMGDKWKVHVNVHKFLIMVFNLQRKDVSITIVSYNYMDNSSKELDPLRDLHLDRMWRSKFGLSIAIVNGSD